MKLAQLVAFRGSAPMNDFVYQLTDVGRERAKKLAEHCSYFGAAPVPLDSLLCERQRRRASPRSTPRSATWSGRLRTC